MYQSGDVVIYNGKSYTVVYVDGRNITIANKRGDVLEVVEDELY